MAVAATVPVEEYLSTSYEPDCEYVDGALIGRNVGELDHSYLQGIVYDALKSRGLFAFVELRLQVRPDRFRIPDVQALRSRPSGRFIKTAPYVVVEIISRDDKATALSDKIDDYASMGVQNIWVIDPRLKRLTVCTAARSEVCADTVTTTDGSISIPLAEFFGDLPATGEVW